MASDDELMRNLEGLLATAQTDEGSSGGRGNIGGGGTVKEFLTYPHAPEITFNGDDGSGTIRIQFDCRVRKKRYESRVEVGTEDYQKPGSVTANFELTRRNRIMITDVAREGGEDKCANSIVDRVNSLNGADLG